MATHIDGVLEDVLRCKRASPRKPAYRGHRRAGTRFALEPFVLARTLWACTTGTFKLKLSLKNVILVDRHRDWVVCLPWLEMWLAWVLGLVD